MAQDGREQSCVRSSAQTPIGLDRPGSPQCAPGRDSKKSVDPISIMVTQLDLQGEATPDSERSISSSGPGKDSTASVSLSIGESAQSITTTPTLPPRSILRWWYFEFLWLFAALLCLGAMIGILMAYQGQRQSSWPSSVLSINSTIALLSTLCRTFLMVAVAPAIAQGKWNELSSRRDAAGSRLGDFALFDHASRGPWGCVRLLWRFKAGHLTCIGAALSIVSLAFSVFTQQLLDSRFEQLFNNNSNVDAGKVPRANNMNSTDLVSSAAKLAIYNGFMAQSIDYPPVTCATGNCTWPWSPTLGVCGACVNTTSSIVVNEYQTGNRRGGMNCNVTAPGGISLEGRCSGTDTELPSLSSELFVIGNGTGAAFASNKSSTAFKNSPSSAKASNVITEFAALGVPRRRWESEEQKITQSQAAECALWYCIQTHEINMRRGSLTDRIVHAWSFVKEHHAQEDYHYIEFEDVPEFLWTHSHESFRINYLKAQEMRRYFDEMMQGNVTYTTQGDRVLLQSTSGPIQGLFESFDDLDGWLERITRSMTNEIRENERIIFGFDNDPDASTGRLDEYYQGEAKLGQAVLVVRWRWMLYPMAVLFTAGVYLWVEAKRSTRMRDIRPWKTDPLVPLYLKLDEELTEAVRRGLEHPDGTEAVSGRYRTRTIRETDGFPVGLHHKQE